MSEKDFRRIVLGEITESPNEAGGQTLTLSPAFSSPEVNYNDEENVKVAAAQALKTANALYSLVHEKCDTSKSASETDNIELFISLSALACEIYMKARLYDQGRNNGKKITGHKLHDLLQNLSDEDIATIIQKIPNIEIRIHGIENAFVDLRYVFELNAFEEEYLLIFDLMEVLHDICAEMKPCNMHILRQAEGTVVIGE